MELAKLLAHLCEVVFRVLEVGDLGLDPQDLHLYGFLLSFDVRLEFEHSSPGTQCCVSLQHLTWLKCCCLILTGVFSRTTFLLIETLEQCFCNVSLALLKLSKFFL